MRTSPPGHNEGLIMKALEQNNQAEHRPSELVFMAVTLLPDRTPFSPVLQWGVKLIITNWSALLQIPILQSHWVSGWVHLNTLLCYSVVLRSRRSFQQILFIFIYFFVHYQSGCEAVCIHDLMMWWPWLGLWCPSCVVFLSLIERQETYI